MTTYGPRRARRTDDNHSEIRDALRGRVSTAGPRAGGPAGGRAVDVLGETAMSIATMLSIAIAAALLLAVIAAAVVWAGGIADEPPATEDEQRQWPRG